MTVADSAIDKLRDFIVQRRKALDLSQRELAKAGGMKPSTVSAVEAGRITHEPRLDTIRSLARGLRINADALIHIAQGHEVELEEVSGILREKSVSERLTIAFPASEQLRQAFDAVSSLPEADQEKVLFALQGALAAVRPNSPGLPLGGAEPRR